MGNRAAIIKNNSPIGIYLHWNGGRDSIESFLTYCKMKGFSSASENWTVPLVHVISNFLSFSGLTLYVNTIAKLDTNNLDNGTFVIGDKWDIIERRYFAGDEQYDDDLIDMLKYIDESQPTKCQLGIKDKTTEEITKMIETPCKRVTI